MASHAPDPSSSHTARRWSGSTAAPAYRPAGAVYRPRRPTETPLYPVVQHHLETFLAEAQDADPMGWGVPMWVERDFRDHASRGARLRCGILAHGFARLRCTDCGHDRLLAFSCKGRGVCPSCNVRRMAEVAVHLTDEVIPHLPTRQWVLSVPKRLRPFLHQTPEVASAVLGLPEPDTHGRQELRLTPLELLERLVPPRSAAPHPSTPLPRSPGSQRTP